MTIRHQGEGGPPGGSAPIHTSGPSVKVRVRVRVRVTVRVERQGHRGLGPSVRSERQVQVAGSAGVSKGLSAPAMTTVLEETQLKIDSTFALMLVFFVPCCPPPLVYGNWRHRAHRFGPHNKNRKLPKLRQTLPACRSLFEPCCPSRWVHGNGGIQLVLRDDLSKIDDSIS